MERWVNSLWPSDAMWQHRSGSIFTQVIASRQMVPSHYLKLCWQIVLWYSPDGNFTGTAQAIYSCYEFENYSLKITAASPRGPFSVKVSSTSACSFGFRFILAYWSNGYFFFFFLTGACAALVFYWIPLAKENLLFIHPFFCDFNQF